MNSFSIFDAHCDTISEILDRKENLLENNLSFSLKSVSEYKCYTQIFAAFVSPYCVPFRSVKRVLQIIDAYYCQLNRFPSYISHANSFKDMKNIHKQRKTASFLSIEGGEGIEDDLSMIDVYYNLGVRFMTLTWEFENKIATGNFDRSNDKGLSEFGRNVVARMNETGMIVDLSHISEKSFWDVNECTKKPYILSHSNAKEICDHPRNINKDQFRALVKAKGVLGINFYPLFLNNSHTAHINDIIKHVEFLLSEGGEDAVGLGSDFDGIDVSPCDLKNPAQISDLLDKLLMLNYSELQVKKIAGGNFENFIKLNLI